MSGLHVVLRDIGLERARQDAKWGPIDERMDHTPEKWLAILVEEVGEVAKEILEHNAERPNYRTELIHTAAVAVSAVQALDREGRA